MRSSKRGWGLTGPVVFAEIPEAEGEAEAWDGGVHAELKAGFLGPSAEEFMPKNLVRLFPRNHRPFDGNCGPTVGCPRKGVLTAIYIRPTGRDDRLRSILR